MSVMYTSGPSNYENNRRNQNYRSSTSRDSTESIRATTGLFSTVAIGLFTFFAYQFISVVFAGMGTMGIVILLAISAATLITAVVVLFNLLEEGKVAIVLLFLALYGFSFFIPGLPAFIALAAIAISVVVTLYLIVAAMIESKWVALAITSVPLIGAAYYVPASISSAGLVGHFTATPSINTPISKELTDLNAAMSQTLPNSAIVSYQIRNNRLYADICANGQIQSLELATTEITKTKIRWLERDLSRYLDKLFAASATSVSAPEYSQLVSVLSPAVQSLQGYDSVMVANGALVNLPHQELLQTPRVFRSAGLQTGQIISNMNRWTDSTLIQPNELAIINALPQSSNDLQKLDLSTDTWTQWQGIRSQFRDAQPSHLKEPSINRSAAKTETLHALQTKRCVLMVIAHCDGFSIKFPNGESIKVDDIESIRGQIQANHPRVFLFSCETARLSGTRAFSKTLLDCGAEVVVAPVTKLSVPEAMDVFRSFLDHAFGEQPIPLNKAFEKALDETNRRMMEVWLGHIDYRRVANAA